MLKVGLTGLMGALLAVFAVVLAADLLRHRDKVKEELAEFHAELDQTLSDPTDAQARAKAEGEFGDVLFSIVNAGRLYDLNPDTALERTCAKFRRRFTYLEEHTIRQGRDLKDMTLAQMDEIWDEAKALEKEGKL